MKTTPSVTGSLRFFLQPLCFVIFLFPFGSTAQERPESVFGDIIDVRVVNLEAVVENRKGERVYGLTPEDFDLWVDGEKVSIDYFDEIREGLAVEPGDIAREAQANLEPGKRVGTSYLVFVDDYFNWAKLRNRALDGIRDYLSRMGPEDRMAIVAFNGKRLEMLTNWSQSPADLQETLVQAKERRSEAFLVRLRMGFSGITAEETVTKLEARVNNLSRAVTATMRSFANPPGRKVMLLVSGGWPYSPRRYVYRSHELPDFDRGNAFYGQIYETANLLGYTLYPIDSLGISSTAGDVTQARPTRGFNTAQEDELHSTLRLIAAATGGRALLDSARMDALDRVVTDTRSYYGLGFTPSWKGNDQSHDIRLEVRQKGLRVRYRDRFFDFSRTKEVSFMVESALLLGDLPGTSPMQVEFLEASKRFSRQKVQARVIFPLDEITFLPHGGRYQAQLELRIGSLDERGYRSDLDLLPFSIDSSRLPEKNESGSQEVTLNLRRRPHDLVFSLHDPLSGKILLEKISYPPKPSEGQPQGRFGALEELSRVASRYASTVWSRRFAAAVAGASPLKARAT